MNCKECKHYMTEYCQKGFGLCLKDYGQPDVEVWPVKTDDDSCGKAEAKNVDRDINVPCERSGEHEDTQSRSE